MTARHTAIETPLGTLLLEATDVGMRTVRWAEDGLPPGTSTGDSDLLVEASAQLRDYFAGRRLAFDLPLDEVGTDFQHAAWAALRSIPFGQTRSYGQQAASLGDARKARAVGGANGRNPIGVITPCHRVIGADGSLTGFAAGTDRKQWLLRHEARVLGATG